MASHTLVYKIHKGIVSVEDYVAWAYTLLQNNVSSNSVNIIASLAPNHNLFEVEDYFQRALNELQMELPTIEPSSRAYIALLATKILKEGNDIEIFNLAKEIFNIVSDLQYPEDLIEWYNISEMVDCIEYDKSPLDFNKEDIKSKIKEESRHLLSSL